MVWKRWACIVLFRLQRHSELTALHKEVGTTFAQLILKFAQPILKFAQLILKFAQLKEDMGTIFLPKSRGHARKGGPEGVLLVWVLSFAQL